MFNRFLLALVLFAAAAPAQTVVSILQGNAQLVPGNLGQPSKPIVFLVTNNGVPVPGAHINITNSQGLVFSPLSSSSLTTDSNGQASTQFLPGILTTASDFVTYFFTATTDSGASVTFPETAYYVSPTLQQGVGVYRLAPDPSQLNPLNGTAGVPTVAFTLQVLATAGSQSGQPIPNVGVHVLLNQNPSASPGSPIQTAYCAEGQGPEHLVLTDSSGRATCTLVFTLPNAALNPSVDDQTFTVTAGDFNSFGPFSYNIQPAPLVLSNPGTRLTLANQPFSLSLSASGGVQPYTFSLAPGSNPLPPGLSLSASGVISGIATTPRLYSFTVQVTDKLGTVASTAETIAVSGGPLQLMLPASPVVATGAPFDLTVRASGGVPPYTMSLTTSLPPGVTFTKSDDVGDTYDLKGSIASPGTYTIGIAVADVVGNVSPVGTFTLTVVAPLSFNPVTLPSGSIGQAYSAGLQASGGQAPYSFTLAPGSAPLPAGLSLSSSGILSGTPAAAGTFTFTVQAADQLRNTANANITLSISGGPLLVTPPPPAVIAPNGSVDLLFHVSGGVPPYTLTLTGATLPSGVTFLKTTANGDTWELKGVFPTAGVFNLSVVANDSLGHVSPGAAVSVTVVTPLVFPPAALPLGAVGQPYTATLQASGGKAPLTFSLTPGSSLPAGLSLSAAGVISGTPLSAGQSAVSVIVTDALLQTAAAQFTLSISGGALAISSSVLPPAVTGTPYSQKLVATGGVPPYSFKFEGAPPAGLTLSSAGVLSGNLALPGTRTFTVDVTDALGNTASAPLQLPVVLPPPAVAGISNGASFLGGPIAPGEIISLFGTNLGPAAAAGLSVDPASGKVTTALAGVQVLVDGIAAPLLYVSSSQINLVVPYGAIHPSATLSVIFQGQQSTAVPVTIQGVEPGIFMIGGTQSAVLNADGTVNGPDNPAARGSEVAIYATGAGQTTPPMTDGQVPGGASTANIAGLTVTIGGQPASVVYAGVAPGMVAGVVQINATIPASAPAGGAVPISFAIGNTASQSTATIAVK